MRIVAISSLVLSCSLIGACVVANPLFQVAGDGSGDPTGATTPSPTSSTAAETGSTAPTTGEPPSTDSSAASTDALTGAPTTTAEATTTTGTATTEPADTSTSLMEATDTGEPMKTLPACDLGDAALRACYEFEFNGDDPSAFLDGSKYANHGQLVGPHIITGINGDALQIAPDTKLVVPAKDDSLSPSPALTMTAWVRLGESFNENRFVIHKKGQYDMIVTPSGLLCHAGIHQLAGMIEAPIPLKQWVHLACVYDNGAYLMFVDGEPYASGQNDAGAINVTASPLTLGCNAECSAITHLDGDLDAVRIWGKALDMTQIQAQAGK